MGRMADDRLGVVTLNRRRPNGAPDGLRVYMFGASEFMGHPVRAALCSIPRIHGRALGNAGYHVCVTNNYHHVWRAPIHRSLDGFTGVVIPDERAIILIQEALWSDIALDTRAHNVYWLTLNIVGRAINDLWGLTNKDDIAAFLDEIAAVVARLPGAKVLLTSKRELVFAEVYTLLYGAHYYDDILLDVADPLERRKRLFLRPWAFGLSWAACQPLLERSKWLHARIKKNV